MVVASGGQFCTRFPWLGEGVKVKNWGSMPHFGEFTELI